MQKAILNGACGDVDIKCMTLSLYNMTLLNVYSSCASILSSIFKPMQYYAFTLLHLVCPNATGGSSTIHTVTTLVTALGLTGVAMLFF